MRHSSGTVANDASVPNKSSPSGREKWPLLSDPLIGSLGDEPRKASDTIRLSTVSVIQKGCQSRFDFLSPSHMNETYVDIPILVSLVFFHSINSSLGTLISWVDLPSTAYHGCGPLPYS
jgi:hypothetical protein